MGTRSQSGARRGRQPKSSYSGMFHDRCGQVHDAKKPCPAGLRCKHGNYPETCAACSQSDAGEKQT